MKKMNVYFYPGLILLVLLLWVGSLMYGAVAIPLCDVVSILFGGEVAHPAWGNIVLQSRFPQAVTALLAGASLAVSGLLLQTLFKNPLAGPSILGVSDGANLGVALVMLSFGSSLRLFSLYTIGGSLLLIVAAFLGASLVLGLIIYFSTKVSNHVMLLIIGIMIGYIASSVISLLNYYASADRLQSFVMWGMGSFSNVSNERLPFFVAVASAGLLFSLLLIKPLNALLLGEHYAVNLGVNIRRTRVSILFCAGVLTAAVTAYCGPISFIGLAVPHIARLLLGRSNHQLLLPTTILVGAAIALLCNMITVLPGTGFLLPLNAVTPIFGAPVIIYVIVNRRHLHYFN